MLTLASGPKAWANASDLWRMGEQCGIGRSFHCVKARGEAAMLRAYHYEDWENPIREEVAKLEGWMATSEHLVRQVHWKRWYQRSFPGNLLSNREDMAKKGITLQGIKKKLCPGEDLVKDRKKLRANLQREAAKANLGGHLGVWEYRIDHKLTRWSLQGNRHRHRDAVNANLRRLGKIVAPRVAAAVWGLVWNRWCTARRFQAEAPCVLGCGQGTDSIEHYIGCAVGREVGRRMLRIDGEYEQRKKLMLGVTTFDSAEVQTCWAVLTYGLYMVTNAHRGRAPTIQTREEAVQEVMQQIRQAVDGHPGAVRVLSTRWVRHL